MARGVIHVIWFCTTAWKWHALNNDHSHRVFIYVLKRGLCSHFPALSPCTDDKVGKASARWRRGVIYNHINPFTFSTGLGYCHLCPRGESRNPTYKQHPINTCGDEPYPYLQTKYGNRQKKSLPVLSWPWTTSPLVRVKSIRIIYST